MIQRIDEAGIDRTPKWFNSPITLHKGSLTEIRTHIPTFERRGFGLAQPGNEQIRMNDRLDTIVRRPFRDDKSFIPVGIVSKDYALVPHTDVLDIASKALENLQIAPNSVGAELKITEYGERMALSLILPSENDFNPGDGNPLALRLECVNSVDGSCRLRIQMCWHRLVCANGLIVGVTSGVRRRHSNGLGLGDIVEVLATGFTEAKKDKQNLLLWRKKAAPKNLAEWIEEIIQPAWGFKAATRAFHIARTGSDVEITGQYKDNTPTTIAVCRTEPVPGAPKETRNLYDVSQILAWLAKERRDLQEQIEWREQIPGLMASLN